MRVLLMLVMLTGVYAVAQESPIKGPATGDPTANSSRPIAYVGCVSSENRTLFLKASNHSPYRLVSTRSLSLNNYAGQRVSLTASNINPGDPSSGERGMGAGSPANAPVTLDVQDIHDIGACSGK